MARHIVYRGRASTDVFLMIVICCGVCRNVSSEEFELEEETWCTRSEQPLPTYPPKHAKQNKVRAGGSLKDSRRRTTMAPANGPMAVRRLSRLPPSSLVKRGSNTKLLVHASVSSLATEPFASPTLPPRDVVIIREKDNPGGKDHTPTALQGSFG